MANTSRIAPVAMLALLLAPAAHADWTLTPAISLTQTLTDNVGLRSRESAHSQWVTQITPGFSVTHSGPRLKLRGSHDWSYFAYGRDGAGSTRKSQRKYQAAADATVIDDLLFVDASAARSTLSRSPFGPQVNNNIYANDNTTEVSTWQISPHVRHRFGATANLSARYTRDSVDASSLGSSEGQSASVQLASGSLFQTLGWGLSYNRNEFDTERFGQSTSEAAGATLSYSLMRTLSLIATVGYDRYDYGSPGGEPTEGRNWSAGFDWTPSPRTRLHLAGGRHFYGNTWDLVATHRSRHSVWSISYDDQITNSRAQFLQPATIDLAAMLDTSFRASIPDPMERRQAIADYLLANGLTPGLANPTPYFSNRFLRQKGLRASVVFTGPRTTLALGAFNVQRTALSGLDSNSELFGADPTTLNDNIAQRGATASLGYRITPRSVVQAGLTASRNRSLTTGLVNNSQALRVGLTRKLGNRMAGAVEARHVRGSAEFGSGRKYHENAISATITMQFPAR